MPDLWLTGDHFMDSVLCGSAHHQANSAVHPSGGGRRPSNVRPRLRMVVLFGCRPKSVGGTTDWLGFTGTFSTNRLYRMLQLKSEINERVDSVTC